MPEDWRTESVKIAYSHPCFELWRLLHYTNYTSTFGGVCGDADGRLRACPGFATTYGRQVRTVSEQQSKRLRDEQVLSADGQRYVAAQKVRTEDQCRSGRLIPRTGTRSPTSGVSWSKDYSSAATRLP